MRTFMLQDTNPFYAPASDECWVLLAREIMLSYSLSYENLFPTTAITQAEYDLLNKQKFAAQRKSILRRIKYGPLKSVVDMPSIFRAFEDNRKINRKRWNIIWEDTFTIDLDNL